MQLINRKDTLALINSFKDETQTKIIMDAVSNLPIIEYEPEDEFHIDEMVMTIDDVKLDDELVLPRLSIGTIKHIDNESKTMNIRLFDNSSHITIYKVPYSSVKHYRMVI